MNQNTNGQFAGENETINIRAELEKYLVYWKWFILSVVIFLGFAVVYVKAQVNVYKTQTSILVEEEGAASELQAFQDLSPLGLGGASNNLYNEIEILKSRTLITEVVNKLNLNYEVYQKQGLKEVECFNVGYQIISDKDDFLSLDTIIDINILDQYQLEYTVENSDEIILTKFGEKITIGDYSFLLTPSEIGYDSSNDNTYQIQFKSLEKTIERYNRIIEILSINDDSSIINVLIDHPVRSKSCLILNTMIDLYNEMSVEDENLVGKKTDEFISRRLERITVELDEIDRLEELYKSDKQITDISVQSKIFVDAKSLNETEIFGNERKLLMIDFLIEDINQQKGKFDLLPTNIGMENNLSFNASILKYNELLFERNRLLRSSSESNPIVKSLNAELLSSISNIKQTLYNIKKQLQLALKSLKSVENEFNDRIKTLPKQAREYTSILRKQVIIAELYSYLLQKKEENEISMAVTLAKSKIIDRAYSSSKPIAPNKKIIIIIGLVLGFMVPFIVIYVKDLLDTKFHSRADLEKHVSIPILGDIPFDKSEEKVIIKQGSRTSTAEAFRLLRTNLDFILAGIKQKSKIVFVTSTISGEGKTFISVNTASSIALTGKKVLLVGMDLRAPKITQYLGLPNRSGVTNYLIGQEDSITDLVFPLQGFDNLDILSSGIVPPNPAELLLNKRLETMFEDLREKYDYIIVDTAPINLVTDTLMMSHHADMFIYVARANYLDKRMLELSEKLYLEKRLANMTMLINGMDHERVYGYGVYGYGGYGYPDEEEKKNFFQKLFKL